MQKWVIDSDLLPAKTFYGNFTGLRFIPSDKYGKYKGGGWSLVGTDIVITSIQNFTIQFVHVTERPESTLKLAPRKQLSLSWQNSSAEMPINAGKFSCRSIFKKSRQMLLFLFS